MISSRSVGSAGRITGSKTMVGHSYASLSDVQPLLLAENRHSGKAYVGIQAVLMCFALKMSSGGMALPPALMHSIAVIHACLPEITFQLEFSRTLTDALDDSLSPTAIRTRPYHRSDLEHVDAGCIALLPPRTTSLPPQVSLHCVVRLQSCESIHLVSPDVASGSGRASSYQWIGERAVMPLRAGTGCCKFPQPSV